MADSPIWVQLLTPVIAAAATWITTKFEVLSFRRLRQYEGIWYAYYRDPDNGEIQEETWIFSNLGRVSVNRNRKITFKGRLSLKGGKAYMNVDSVQTGDEKLFVMLEPPNNPRNGDERASICLWLGKDGGSQITAGHGLMSRNKLDKLPDIKKVFLRAIA